MQICRHLTDATGSEITMAHIAHEGSNKKASDDELYFFMKTYSKLAAGKGAEAWDMFYGLTNKFLAQMTAADKKDLYAFYKKGRERLNTVTADNYTSIIAEIASDLGVLLNKVNIPKQLLEFVEKENLLFPDLKGIGQRAHDKSHLTFKLPEYHILTAMSIFCKMMSPIWGDFVYRTSDYIDTSNKESHCLMMINPMLDHPSFVYTSEKLRGYMANTIKSFFNKQQNYHKNDAYDLSFTLANSGFGEDRFSLLVQGMLFVKKLALYDPIPEKLPDGTTTPRDIMKYIAVNITATINTAVQSLQNASNTMVRRDPSRSMSDGERDSVTILENESIVSKVPADIPIYARFGAEVAIKRMLESNNIPAAEFQSAIKYYERNLFHISPFTKTVVSTYLGRLMGGARTLQYLTAQPMIKLVVLTQLLLSKEWPPQFIHMLTATYPATAKEVVASPVDQRIRITYEPSSDYRQVVSLFPFILGQHKSIKQQIADVVSYITEHDQYYNTAPAVTGFMGEPDAPKGDLVAYDEFIIQQLCEFLIRYSDVADAA